MRLKINFRRFKIFTIKFLVNGFLVLLLLLAIFGYSLLNLNEYSIHYYLRKVDIINNKYFKALETTSIRSYEATGDSDFDRICKNEWEKHSSFTFFKRDSAFYLIDLNILHIYFTSHCKMQFNFEYEIIVHLKGKGQTRSIVRDNVRLANKYEVAYQCLFKIDIPFALRKNPLIRDMHNLNDLISNDRIKIYLFINDYMLNEKTQNPIDVKLRFIQAHSRKKHSAMICSKCYWLKKASAKHMEWWIELNKRIGFEKIVICNNTIEGSDDDSEGFNRLFRKYSDYLSVNELKCMPYINKRFLELPASHDDIVYYKSLTEFISLWFTDIFDLLMFNVCYLNYAQDYRYVSVIDFDETFLPPMIQDQFSIRDNFNWINQLDLRSISESRRTIESVKCNYYTSGNPFENYVKDLSWLHGNYILRSSFYLQTGWMLKNRLIAKIFTKLDDYLSDDKLNRSLEHHLIKIYDFDPKTNEHLGVNLTINMSNGNSDIMYARNLIKVYNLYLEPYLNEIDDQIVQMSDQFNRFFILLSITDNEFVWGKSIHDTMVSTQVCHHYPCGSYKKNVDPNLGHLSHFRRSYSIPNDHIINIRQIIFDINYLNCYFKPILSSFKYRTV